MRLAFLALLALACQGPPAPLPGPKAGECWTLTGTGPISSICSTPERLCVRPREGERCWQCAERPPPLD